MQRIYFLVLLFFASFSAYAQIEIKGIIKDSSTLEVLPFVNIAVKNTTQGTVSSLNGKFSITVKELPATLLFSYVGYRKQEILVTTEAFLTIRMKNDGISLNEATVIAGENPALKIMRKVLKNRSKNNPESNGSFQYLSYNKLKITVDDEYLNTKLDTTNSDDSSMYYFFKKQYLFLSESVTEKKYLSPNKNKETLIASKISGFSAPVFTLLSTQLQSFHFYKDEISLGEIKYIGPVSPQGLKHYHFELKDTFYLENDSVYSIVFKPWKENDYRSLEGVLQIHTNGYAIYNVKAKPFLEKADGLSLAVSQQYSLIENKQWFPLELKTILVMGGMSTSGFPIVGTGTSQIKNVMLNPDFDRKEFGVLEVEIDENSLKLSDEKLLNERGDSLNTREKNTYHVMDSLGKAHHLDHKILVITSIAKGYVPIKFVDWDLTKFMNYNDYEGFRLGLGMRTNSKISKWFHVGGYGAFGFKDKAFKYGGEIAFHLSEKNNIHLTGFYSQDVEAASQIMPFEPLRLLANSGFSSLFVNRFDSLEKYEARFQFRALKHFQVILFSNYQNRNPASNYAFKTYLSETISFSTNNYHLFESGVEIKMAINEKYIESPFGYISTGTKWPVVYFRYTKGLKGIWNSDYNYERITLRTQKMFSSVRWGKLNMLVQAGKVNGDTPYHLLFNPSGTYKPIRQLTVYSIDGFETMRLNEFLFDEFVSGIFKYTFPKPLVNTKKFKPVLGITSAIAWGWLNQGERHEHIYYFANGKPFTESGIVLDNLYNSGFSGFGIGVFYRWGEQQLHNSLDNFAIKLSLSYSL